MTAKEKLREIIKALNKCESHSEMELISLQLRQEAKSAPELFANLVSKYPIYPFDGSPLSKIYLALAPDAQDWQELILSEMERVLEYARSALSFQNNNKIAAIKTLQSFSVVASEEENPLDRGIRKLLIQGMESGDSYVQRAALNLFHHFLHDDKHSIAYIQNLLNDKNWNVRYLAFKCLETTDHLPEGYSPKPHIRLYNKLFDPLADPVSENKAVEASTYSVFGLIAFAFVSVQEGVEQAVIVSAFLFYCYCIGDFIIALYRVIVEKSLQVTFWFVFQMMYLSIFALCLVAIDKLYELKLVTLLSVVFFGVIFVIQWLRIEYLDWKHR